MPFFQNKQVTQKIAGCIFLLFCSMFLSACEKESSISYLMQHPADLKQALDQCRLTVVKSSEDKARCETVRDAAANIESLINDMRQNPEQFGQMIMDEERLCVQAKTELDQSKQLVAEGKLTEDKFRLVEQAYHDQQDKVKALLAVAGMGSPE